MRMRFSLPDHVPRHGVTPLIPMAAAPELTYRSRLFAVIGRALVAVIAIVTVTVLLARPAPLGLWLPLTVGGGAGAAWIVRRCYLAPRVVVNDRGVRIVNPFGTTELRWREVARFESSPMLTVVRHDGTTVTAWAVQWAAPARLIGRTSAGDAVADALTRQLVAATESN